MTDRQSQSSLQATEDDWRPPAMLGCEFLRLSAIFKLIDTESACGMHYDACRLYRCTDPAYAGRAGNSDAHPACGSA